MSSSAMSAAVSPLSTMCLHAKACEKYRPTEPMVRLTPLGVEMCCLVRCTAAAYLPSEISCGDMEAGSAAPSTAGMRQRLGNQFARAAAASNVFSRSCRRAKLMTNRGGDHRGLYPSNSRMITVSTPSHAENPHAHGACIGIRDGWARGVEL